MDKSLVIKTVIEDFKKQAEETQTAIDYAYEQARSAPASTESWSDGRRREQQQMAAALQTTKQKIDNAIKTLMALDPNQEPPAPQIGSLIKTNLTGKDQWYFIVPYAGGKTFTLGNETVITLSPESPLGQKILLLGKP
jgi:hypothetical protein